ncbi:MAG: hypothetical protein PHD36_08225, partial [Desulfotomaculaceae bacterium]|nr:hypothetical protein [Desulfotomaculaceae bacterium]
TFGGAANDYGSGVNSRSTRQASDAAIHDVHILLFPYRISASFLILVRLQNDMAKFLSAHVIICLPYAMDMPIYIAASPWTKVAVMECQGDGVADIPMSSKQGPHLPR